MSTALSVFSKFQQYGGHLVNLAEIALIHAGGQIVLNSGFNLTGLSAEDLQQVTNDKLKYETTIEQAEAIRQSNEATRIKNENQRVYQFSVIMNNLGAITSAQTAAAPVAAADVMVPNDGDGPDLPQPEPHPVTFVPPGTIVGDGDGN